MITKSFNSGDWHAIQSVFENDTKFYLLNRQNIYWDFCLLSFLYKFLQRINLHIQAITCAQILYAI